MLPKESGERTPDWWDRWMLGLARYISTASKDPSTKVGALIVSADRTPVSWGYNGFPRRIMDTPDRLRDRETKYRLILHAERNALLFAGLAARGGTLVTYPFPPCSVCAAMVIQAGIQLVVAPQLPDRLVERWGEDCGYALQMLSEAGVGVRLLNSVDTE